MKTFFKLMLHGFLLIGIAVMSLALLIFPIVILVTDMPNLTGFKAVGLFILSILQFGCGCFLTCMLGWINTTIADVK